jgi:hypothetical protein
MDRLLVTSIAVAETVLETGLLNQNHEQMRQQREADGQHNDRQRL